MPIGNWLLYLQLSFQVRENGDYSLHLGTESLWHAGFALNDPLSFCLGLEAKVSARGGLPVIHDSFLKTSSPMCHTLTTFL